MISSLLFVVPSFLLVILFQIAGLTLTVGLLLGLLLGMVVVALNNLCFFLYLDFENYVVHEES